MGKETPIIQSTVKMIKPMRIDKINSDGGASAKAMPPVMIDVTMLMLAVCPRFRIVT